MKNQSIFGSKLSLLELVVVLGFFALLSSMCLRILVSANRMAEGNHELINAISAAQNAAECYKANYLPAYYDEDWNPSGKDEANYFLAIESRDEHGINNVSIDVYNQEGTVIFTLNVKDLKEVD